MRKTKQILKTSAKLMTANGGNNAAGIGSGRGGSCGNITIDHVIEGSFVVAQGGNYGPGIGAGLNGTCGSINIKGDEGRVICMGGSYTPGIGAAAFGKCGVITLNHKIEATGGMMAPGIGTGNGNSK